MRAITSGVDSIRQGAPHSLFFRFFPKWGNCIIGISDLNIRHDGLTNALCESVRESLVASRMQRAQQANKRRRSSPECQLGALVKIHCSASSRESLFNTLEPIFLVPYPVIKYFPDSDNYTIKTPLAPSGQIKMHSSLLAPLFANTQDKFPSRATPEPVTAIRIAEDSDEHKHDLEWIIKDQPSK